MNVLIALNVGIPGQVESGNAAHVLVRHDDEIAAFCSWNRIQALLIFRLDGTEISQTAPLPWPGNPGFSGEGMERGE